jgi:hypothetical protein
VKQGPVFTASLTSRGIASLAGVSRSSVRLFWRYRAAFPVPLICPLRRRRMRTVRISNRHMYRSSRKSALRVEEPADHVDRVLDPLCFRCVRFRSFDDGPLGNWDAVCLPMSAFARRGCEIWRVRERDDFGSLPCVNVHGIPHQRLVDSRGLESVVFTLDRVGATFQPL